MQRGRRVGLYLGPGLGLQDCRPLPRAQDVASRGGGRDEEGRRVEAVRQHQAHDAPDVHARRHLGQARRRRLDHVQGGGRHRLRADDGPAARRRARALPLHDQGARRQGLGRRVQAGLRIRRLVQGALVPDRPLPRPQGPRHDHGLRPGPGAPGLADGHRRAGGARQREQQGLRRLRRHDRVRRVAGQHRGRRDRRRLRLVAAVGHGPRLQRAQEDPLQGHLLWQGRQGRVSRRSGDVLSSSSSSSARASEGGRRRRAMMMMTIRGRVCCCSRVVHNPTPPAPTLTPPPPKTAHCKPRQRATRNDRCYPIPESRASCCPAAPRASARRVLLRHIDISLLKAETSHLAAAASQHVSARREYVHCATKQGGVAQSGDPSLKPWQQQQQQQPRGYYQLPRHFVQ
mmetsp:Transcript_5686/g.23633  ORF Transcript_5686/g.23633 Transcript_5686/m.23633 type:complete len:401 (-) Transcript_5686:1387-2589(-)